MNEAKYLDQQLRVLDDTSISADSFIGDIGTANLTLILNLDELNICNESKHLYHMSNDLIGGNSLDQLDLIISLEICHLILDLPNDLKVVAAKHQLHIDVDAD